DSRTSLILRVTRDAGPDAQASLALYASAPLDLRTARAASSSAARPIATAGRRRRCAAAAGPGPASRSRPDGHDIVCQSRPEPASCNAVGLRFPARLTILRTFRPAPLVVRASQRRRAVFGPTAVPPGARTVHRSGAAASRVASHRPATCPVSPVLPGAAPFPGRHPEPARRGLSLFRLCFVP
ncbi:hypothetical protein LGM33_38610, partial [Burkholderia cepacia]|nr:hypothetical protein [Burkholderia cepacia]